MGPGRELRPTPVLGVGWGGTAGEGEEGGLLILIYFFFVMKPLVAGANIGTSLSLSAS